MFRCRAGATSTRQKQRHSATMIAQALTVLLEPSFVPFWFCMTVVADLESVMSAGRSIPSGEGVWYVRTGVWMWCSGVEKYGRGTRFIYTQRACAPEM